MISISILNLDSFQSQSRHVEMSRYRSRLVSTVETSMRKKSTTATKKELQKQFINKFFLKLNTNPKINTNAVWLTGSGGGGGYTCKAWVPQLVDINLHFIKLFDTTFVTVYYFSISIETSQSSRQAFRLTFCQCQDQESRSRPC